MSWPKPITPKCPSCHHALEGWVPRNYYMHAVEAYIALLKKHGEAPPVVDADGLTVEQQACLASYVKDMETIVIPEIIAAIRARQIAAAKTRNWLI